MLEMRTGLYGMRRFVSVHRYTKLGPPHHPPDPPMYHYVLLASSGSLHIQV